MHMTRERKGEIMGAYSAYPKGVYLVGTHTVTDPAKLAGADFIVAHMANGTKRTANFTQHIQSAADAGRPLVAYFENDPESFVTQYNTLDLAHWLKTPMDNYLMRDAVAPSLLAGTSLRKAHAVMVGMNKWKQINGKIIPDDWMLDCYRFFKIAIEKTWGIPVFPYIDPDNAKRMSADPKSPFVTFLGGKDAEGNYNLPGISTAFNAFAVGGPVAADWGSLPEPGDEYTAALRQMKVESGLGNAKGLEFVCYSAGRFTLPGITGNTVPLWYWQGSKAGLYDRLKFTPPVVTPDPIPGGGGDEDGEPGEGETGEGGEVMAALAAALDAAAAAWLKARGKA